MGLDPIKIQKLSSLASGTLKKANLLMTSALNKFLFFSKKRNPDPVCSKCEKQTGQI